jgi:hypothetical protein
MAQSKLTAAEFAAWVVPALPLYGNDHHRGDLAP